MIESEKQEPTCNCLFSERNQKRGGKGNFLTEGEKNPLLVESCTYY
jgi:hypothetical protein